MKVQVFLPLTIALSAALVVLIKVRQEEKEREDKRGNFLDIKLRVSDDVLREYASEKEQINQDIDTAKDEYKVTDEARKAGQEEADKAAHEAAKCAEEQTTIKEELDKLTAEHTNLKAESDKELEVLKAEMEVLKKNLQELSPVCAFVKNTEDANKLCSEEVKTEEPKQDEAPSDVPATTVTVEDKKEEPAAQK